MDISDLLTDFKLDLPDVKGRSVHAISAHLGWLNWGEVGKEVFNELVKHFDAKKIGELARPGDFYNFITYREYSHTHIDSEGVRYAELPNSKVYYVRRQEPLSDLVLLYLLEPTQFAEIYVDRVVAMLKKLNVVRYQVAGAMGSPVPHTRPIRVTGRSTSRELTERLREIGVRATAGGGYRGPTSIFNSISSTLQNDGVTTVSLIAHMPTYLSLEVPDSNGVFSILNVVSELEAIDIPLGSIASAGQKQYESVSQEVLRSQSVNALTKELEEMYDLEEEEENPEEETETRLPPKIQRAIDEDIDDVFGKN